MQESTGRNIAERSLDEILSVLDRFSILIKQIYTITTNNGQNFIKASGLFRNKQIEDTLYGDDEYKIDDEELKLVLEDLECIDYAKNYELSSDDLEIEDLDEEDEDEFELLELQDCLPVVNTHLTSVKQQIFASSNICFRCAAHTVQLPVYDVLKTKSLSRFLTNARKLVKIMRCQPYVNSFKLDQCRNLPFMDGDTRWGSAYLLINRLQDEKDFIISLLPPQLLKSFNTKFWQRVDQFVLAAKPVYILTERILLKLCYVVLSTFIGKSAVLSCRKLEIQFRSSCSKH
ncbi:uncharacterized protein LOC129728026 [Wyeomyia smithii]|uniref:uncharacterized protein LOC129728026 n=1 Tax=Wyeomyia smithii TaxID=174621 RepID=UPI002467F4E1|nr:uncharacterized protein LOC129728026 [Wyeomyia smithii]